MTWQQLHTVWLVTISLSSLSILYRWERPRSRWRWDERL